MHTKHQEMPEYRIISLLNSIISVCWGLIVVSLVLVLLHFIDFSSLDSFIFIDNQFFGKIIQSIYLLGFYLFDIVVLALVIWFLEKNVRVLFIALPWFVFNFLETFFDLFVFRYDFHFVFEELVFLALYSYLMVACTMVLFPQLQIRHNLKNE